MGRDIKNLVGKFKEKRQAYTHRERIVFDQYPGFIVFKCSELGRNFLDIKNASLLRLIEILAFDPARLKEILETGYSSGKDADIYIEKISPNHDNHYIAKYAQKFWTSIIYSRKLPGISERTEWLHATPPFAGDDGYIPIECALRLADILKELPSNTVVPMPWLFCEEPKYFKPFGLYNYGVDKIIDEDLRVQAVEGMVQTYVELGNELSSAYDHEQLQSDLKKIGLLSGKENYNKLIFLEFLNCPLLYKLYNTWLLENNLKESSTKEEDVFVVDRREGYPDIHKLLFNEINDYLWDADVIVNDERLSEFNQQLEEYFALREKNPQGEQFQEQLSAEKKAILQKIDLYQLAIDIDYRIKGNQQKIETYFEEHQWTSLLRYYRALQQLNAYKNSDAYDEQINAQTDGWVMYCMSTECGILYTQISLEWFLNTEAPEGYSAIDWLAKCDKVFKQRKFTEQTGILNAVIDDKKVCLKIDMEEDEVKLMSATLE